MNLRKLRYLFLLYAAFDLFIGGVCGGFLPLSQLAAAQFTTVSGTVVDPNGLPYANGTITAALVSSSSPKFTATNQPYTPPTQPVGLSSAGSFVMNLADNTQLTPGGTTWNFTVSCAAGCVPPVFGTGPVTFTITGVTISGASQSITGALTAAAPALTAVITSGNAVGLNHNGSTVVLCATCGPPSANGINMTSAAGDTLYMGGGELLLTSSTGGTALVGQEFQWSDASAHSQILSSPASITFTESGSAANFAPFNFIGSVFTGGTGTSTFPFDYIHSTGSTNPTTWNTSGTMEGINAPSGFAGNFADYRVNGGASVYSVNAAGGLTSTSITDSGLAQGQPIGVSSTGQQVPIPNHISVSQFSSLASAVGASALSGGGILHVDSAITLPASTLNINVPNLTLLCDHPLAAITFVAGSRIQFGNGGNAPNARLQGCNFKGPDMASVGGAPITFGTNGNADGAVIKDVSINGWGSTSSNGVIALNNASNVEVSGVRSGDQAVGPVMTVSTATWAAPDSFNNVGATGARSGSAVVTLTAGAPATWGTPFRTINGSNVVAIVVSGCSVGAYNGTFVVTNNAAGTASLTYTAGSSATDTATGCLVQWNSLLGLESITMTASLPTDAVQGNAVLCSGMSPVGYNKPGDQSSSFFGQIFSTSGNTIVVQQIYNPGTYVSGGTCQAGVGNGDQDIAITANTGSGILNVGNWNLHDNSVGSIVLHNATPNSMVGTVKLVNNSLFSGLSNGYHWCSEIGSFQGTNSAIPFAFHNVTLTANVCNIVGPTGDTQQNAGGFSQGNSQDVTETAQKCYGNGFQFNTQCDENAGAERLTSVGSNFNMLGGGAGEDINRVNDAVVSDNTMLFAGGLTSNPVFMLAGIANGGIGNLAAATSSGNNVSGNILTARVGICPDVGAVVGAVGNTCGAQINQIVGNGVTATVTFTSGVVDPGLLTGNTVQVAGNTQAGFNGLQTIASVTGAGTGFTFSSGTNATGTGGKATGAGLTTVSTNTNVAHFNLCPHPFRIGDVFGVSLSTASAGSFNTAIPTTSTVTSITELPPCTVTYTATQTAGNHGGNGIASNFNNKFLQFQQNITVGQINNNNFGLNLMSGGGPTMGGSICYNISNNGTTGTIDGNQFIRDSCRDVSTAVLIGGSSGQTATNTKFELGSMADFTNLLTLTGTGIPTFADATANPQTLMWSGTGTATSSATLFPFPNCGTTLCQPVTTLTATVEGGWYVAPHSYSVSDLSCTAGTPSGGADTAVLRINKVNKAAYTCNLTAASCAIAPNASATGSAGDIFSVVITTTAADALTNVVCKAHVWYGN